MMIKTDHKKIVMFYMSECISEQRRNKAEVLADKNICYLFHG